jgi:hypothetical protein
LNVSCDDGECVRGWGESREKERRERWGGGREKEREREREFSLAVNLASVYRCPP